MNSEPDLPPTVAADAERVFGEIRDLLAAGATVDYAAHRAKFPHLADQRTAAFETPEAAHQTTRVFLGSWAFPHRGRKFHKLWPRVSSDDPPEESEHGKGQQLAEQGQEEGQGGPEEGRQGGQGRCGEEVGRGLSVDLAHQNIKLTKNAVFCRLF